MAKGTNKSGGNGAKGATVGSYILSVVGTPKDGPSEPLFAEVDSTGDTDAVIDRLTKMSYRLRRRLRKQYGKDVQLSPASVFRGGKKLFTLGD